MACYGREGIEAISSALLTLRRRSGGATWLRADDAPATLLGPVGDYIVRAFQCRDFLEAHRHDESLMAQCLRTAPEASVSHTSGRAPDGSWATRSRVRLTKGFGYEEELDPGTAHLLARCDGTRPLRELLGAAGRAPRLDLVRRLIERGFLLPAGPRVA